MARRERGKKIAPGIWKDEFGYAVIVSVGSGKNKLTRETRYAFETKLKTMTNWQEETRVALRKLSPKHGKGTLAASVVTYLKAVGTMVTIKGRERDLARWVEEFPNRQRHSIKPHEISAVLHELLKEGYAPSTVLNFRTALMAVWTTLDGEQAYNPVKESFTPEGETRIPQDIAYSIIDKVLAAIPDFGPGEKRAKAVCHPDRDMRAKGLCSSCYQKKQWDGSIAVHKYEPTGKRCKTKIRLRLMAFTGLPHKLMKQIDKEKIDWDERKFWAAKRRKGNKVDSRRLPLTDEAYAALVDFDQFDCYGTFSNSSMWKTWRKAWIRAFGYAPTKERPQILNNGDGSKRVFTAIPSPYKLRHSFATDALKRNGGSEPGVAGLLMHSAKSDIVKLYTLGAVPDLMQQTVNGFNQHRLQLVQGGKKGKKPTRRKALT